MFMGAHGGEARRVEAAARHGVRSERGRGGIGGALR